MDGYRLTSSGMIHTPGVFRFLCVLYRGGDTGKALEVLAAGYPDLPAEAAEAALRGTAEVKIDDEAGMVLIKLLCPVSGCAEPIREPGVLCDACAQVKADRADEKALHGGPEL